MATPRFVARQLSQPTGLGGWFIRQLMNRGNAALNRFAIKTLALSDNDRVLEIGFGGGVALPALLWRASIVVGVDRSPDVVAVANRRFASAVAAGRAEFRCGEAEALPLADASFDKLLTVNTVYFWTSLETGFAEAARVLAPGGRIAVGFLPKDRMERIGFPADIFTPRAPEEVAAALAQAGFSDVSLEKPEPDTPWTVAIGRR